MKTKHLEKTLKAIKKMSISELVKIRQEISISNITTKVRNKLYEAVDKAEGKMPRRELSMAVWASIEHEE